MPAVPSWTNLALLLDLSFVFGLAFEEFYRKNGPAGASLAVLAALTVIAAFLVGRC